MKRLLVVLLPISWFFWSFTQTDPNLYYSSSSLWVNFQQTMWQISRPVVVVWFIGMIIVAFAFYLLAKYDKQMLGLFAACLVVLAVSNNALSHDLYNYMFNSKAIAVYHQDPHLQSALEIAPHDDWVRFMHNVQTPAPYGHFWTFATLVPFSMGLGKFVTTFLAFKIFMFAGYLIMIWVFVKMHAKNIWLFALNPLVLIETFSSGHNDVWMMVLALGSFALLLKAKKSISIQTVVSFLLLLLSTQIKEATVLLIPLWLILASKKVSLVDTYWPEIAAILMFLPLLTSRSQQFNPWYLIWSLTFLPFIKTKFVKVLLITFSVTSLLRYVPFLFVGEYTDAIQLQMRVITWLAIPVSLLLWPFVRKKKLHV